MTKIEEYLIKKKAKEQLEAFAKYRGNDAYNIGINIIQESPDKYYLEINTNGIAFNKEAIRRFGTKIFNELGNIAIKAARDLEVELNEMKEEVRIELKEILG